MSDQRVVVTDFDMSFGSMVGFMVKWAFASIPAMLIIGAVIAVMVGLGSGLIAGIGSGLIEGNGSP